MLKVKSLLEKEVCELKNEYSKLSSSKGKSYFIAIGIKNVFSKYDFDKIDETIVTNELEEACKSFKFINDYEKNLSLDTTKERILSFIEFEKHNQKTNAEINLDFVNGGEGIVNVLGNDISVSYDFIKINKDSNIVEIFKLKNTKKTIKKSGRSNLTSLDRNKEVFLLYKVAKNMFPSFNCLANIVFLKEFDGKSSAKFSRDTYSVRRDYDSREETALELSIEDLLNAKGTPCKSSDCNSCSYLNVCTYKEKDLSSLTLMSKTAKASGTVTFTESQEEFINVKKGVYRVLAGAGSGKTTVIANNVVHLVKEGIRPKDILLITFTNKGVEELSEKIEYWLKVNSLPNDIKEFDIFTFNSYGYELIKAEYSFLGFTKEPTVIDKLDKYTLLNNLVTKYPKIEGLNYEHPFMDFFNAKGVIVSLSEIFDTIKKYELSYLDLNSFYNYNDSDLKTIYEIYVEYNNELYSKNLIEFNDQVPMGYKILSNPDYLKKYSKKHIICDEFQDSDLSQINLLKLLYSYAYCQSLCVCGDDSQAIFSWRGANRNNILDFKDYFNDVKDIKMVENFRSNNEICKLANAINLKDSEAINKNIFSTIKGVKPTLVIDSGDTLVKSIRELLHDGVKPHQIAYISRKRNDLMKVNEILSENNIPSLMKVPELLVDNKSIICLGDFFKFLVDNSLDMEFSNYLKVNKTKEFNLALEKGVLSDFVEKERDLFLNEFNALPTEKERLEYLYKLLSDLSVNNLYVKKLLENLISKNFKTIFELVEYTNKLIQYKSDIYVSNDSLNYDAVTLITAHSSKGKEYDYVFINLDGFSNLEVSKEELRLLFVAVTRAKKDLCIISSSANQNFKYVKTILDNVK